MPLKHDSSPEAFWARVNKTETCWIWGGSINKVDGYGMYHRGQRKYTVAHRVAYEFAVGPIPAGKIILHICDNPPCVNPDHLRVGTKGDNNRDSMAKGRRRTAPPRGENEMHSRKLTWADVLEIRHRHPLPLPATTRPSGYTMKGTARDMGVCASVVRNIALGVKWKYPPEEWIRPEIPRKGPNPNYLPTIAARLDSE